MPAKIGKDAGTQIEDGELFNFDVEVEPILEVLVGKTLERGMMECCEEEELSAMRRHQNHFQQLREQELIEVQDAGMFHNPNLTAVESLFMPWIFRSVEERINNCKRNEQVANSLLRSAIADSTAAHKESL